MKRFLFLVLLLPTLFVFGEGCQTPSFLSSPSSSTSSTLALAEDVAQHLRFSPGDSFEMRQTLLGFGSFLPDFTKSSKGVHVVRIEKFSPLEQASLRWSLLVERETDQSKQARADYETKVREQPTGIGEEAPLQPPVVMETVTTTGLLDGINLAKSHTLYPPLYWTPGDMHLALGKSGIWLADEAWMELVKTRKTTLNLGVFDEDAGRLIRNLSTVKADINKLRNSSTDTQAQISEPTLLEAESNFIEWPLKINGTETKVSTIRAKNWFGEVVVLNNRENPLILKLTFNPVLSGATDLLKGAGPLDKFFGYEIQNLVVKDFK